MIKWNDIPAYVKLTTATVMVLFTVVTFLFATFQTDVEAAQYQEQNTREIVRFRVQDLEKQIRELEYKMEFTAPPVKEKLWMQKQIEKLKGEIEKIQEGRA
jgi:peptidoglycan hydrolase CwlO-like protein